MSSQEAVDRVTRALREQARGALVTSPEAAEQEFWRRHTRPARTARAARLRLGAAVASVMVVVAILTGLALIGGDDSRRTAPPAVPTDQVSPRALSSTAADAVSHLIGNGTVVGDRLWFVLGDQLVITDGLGRQVSTQDLPEGTDGELLCCVERVGTDVVVVPTADGYSHRDAATGRALATTRSTAPGPAAAVGDQVWLRRDADRLVLVGAADGRPVRTLRVPAGVDLVAADESVLVVISGAQVRRLDPVTGSAEWQVALPAPGEAMTTTPALVVVADSAGRLTVLDRSTGEPLRRWEVPAESRGIRPRVVDAQGELWWSPDAGTVVRLDAADGSLRDAVAVGLGRLWDNADQQRNGLYVTSSGIWVPTRNDADDYEFHRLPPSLRRP